MDFFTKFYFICMQVSADEGAICGRLKAKNIFNGNYDTWWFDRLGDTCNPEQFHAACQQTCGGKSH